MSIEQSAIQLTSGEPNPVDKDGICLLSLDGGGVRGLSSLHILKRIMDELNRFRKEKGLPSRLPCQVFDIIGGTSTGGIIAIMLGRLEMSADECIKEYEDLMGEVFGEKIHRWSVTPFNLGNYLPRYDAQKLKKEIENVLEKRGIPKHTKFNDGEERRCRVFVCSTYKNSMDSVRIRSYDQRLRDNNSATICEAALATSAATTYFEPATIGQSQYVDGAFRQNNPVNQVEAEARDIWCRGPDDVKPLTKCFLSIGTGIPPKQALGDNITKLLPQIIALATDTEETHKDFQDRWSRPWEKKRYFRFDVSQMLHDVGLDAYKEKGTIKDATNGYLDGRDQQNELQACAENLMEKELQGTPLNFHETMMTYRLRAHGSYDSNEVRDCLAMLYVTNVMKDRYDLKIEKGDRVPGTFEWIINDKRYKSWQNSGPDSLSITGGPARGKTMLALFILENLEQNLSPSWTGPDSVVKGDIDKKVDIYYFFCSPTEGRRRSAVAVLKNLIYQIVSKYRYLMKHLLDYLKPTSLGSERFLETDRPTGASDQSNDESMKQSKDSEKEQRSPSVNYQSPALPKLPVQSGFMKNIRHLRDAVEQKPEMGTEDRSENKSKILQNPFWKTRKEDQSMDEFERQQEPPSNSYSEKSESASKKEASKSRQLELLRVSDLSYILGKLIQEMDIDRAYFLLDGLDECEEDQEALVSTLIRLSNIKSGKFKLLIVSQAVNGMSTIPAIKLENKSDDIQKFIANSVGRLNVDGFDQEMRREVEGILLDRAEGTFLWVSLVMDEIIGKTKTCTEILDAIKAVPPGLNSKYSRMLQQIRKEHQSDVFKILRWVIVAVRPLTLQELSTVMDASSSYPISSEQVVRDAVTHSEGLLETRGDVVTLVHATAKDFLISDDAGKHQALNKFRLELQEMHYQVAQSCYDYIRHSVLSRNERKVSEFPDNEDPRLLKYAIRHWMEHVKASNWAEMNFDPDAEFFRRDSKLRKNWWTAYLEDSQNDDPKNFNVSSLLHLAAYFGIVSWIRRMFHGLTWVAREGTVLMELDNYYRTPLHIAVEQGHAEVVSLLLEQGTNIEFREASLFATPLLLAAPNGRKEICEILLDHGAKVNARNLFKSTPLTEAARGGHMEVVKLLVSRGADVNGSIEKGHRSLYRQLETVPSLVQRQFGNIDDPEHDEKSTPIIEAARRNHAEIISYLSSWKADIDARNLAGRNALHIAAFHNQTKSMEILLKLGADIEQKDNSSYTALFLAAWQNHADAVKWLLDHDADINSATNWRFTPLLVAARNGNMESLRILLEAQAKIESRDEKGHTALTVAAKWGKVEAVKLLLESNANINAQDKTGDTALMWAIQDPLRDEYVEILQALVMHGANVNHQNDRGHTPLMKVAEVSDDDATRIVRRFLDEGAKIGIKDNKGRTALMHAVFKESSEKTRELLLDSGAALEDKDDLGDTPLIVAAGYSDSKTVKWLLDRGANIEARNNLGYTPLMKAAKCGLEDTINSLLDRGADIAAVDHDGKTALEHAAVRERGDIIKLLTNRGASRENLTWFNFAAESLSKVMHWTIEAVREWEQEWEEAEWEKLPLEKRSTFRNRDDSGAEDQGVSEASGDASMETAHVDEEGKKEAAVKEEGSVDLDAKEQKAQDERAVSTDVAIEEEDARYAR